MKHLIYFGVVFIIVELVYLLILNRGRLKKYNKLQEKKSTEKKNESGFTKTEINNIGESSYVIGKFKLKKTKVNMKQLMIIMSLANAFIMAFVCVVIAAIPLGVIWQLMIGFVLLFALIYSIYEIIGRILVKKGWK